MECNSAMLFKICIDSAEIPAYAIELRAANASVAKMQAVYLFNYKYPLVKIHKVTVRKLK